MTNQNKLIVYTDGGSRGNPGPSALGVVILNSDKSMLVEIGKAIGITTNNMAEYLAVLEALSWIKQQGIQNQYRAIDVFMDSQLLCRQLTGVYKVKHQQLKALMIRIKEIEKKLGIPILYHHVRRENNKEADRLVNLALDNRI